MAFRREDFVPWRCAIMRRLLAWSVCLFVLVALFGTANFVRADEVNGTISGLSLITNEVAVIDATNGQELILNASMTNNIRLNDKNVPINQLKPGDRVRFIYDFRDDQTSGGPKRFVKDLDAVR
jgi:hypothetical protein